MFERERKGGREGRREKASMLRCESIYVEMHALRVEGLGFRF